MATLVWDQSGERSYQSGVDRGVLYLNDGTVAVWNGLINVEESTDSELKQFYHEGVKYLQNLVPGDFSAKLTAFTYPEEFDSVTGIADFNPGLDFYDQPSKSFGLSYRSKIGTDLDADHGYKIHLLYDLLANPEAHTFTTLQDKGEAIEFSWALTGTPQKIAGHRPTVHLSIDSTTTPPEILSALEGELYGTDRSDPRLPPLTEVAKYFGYLGALIIVDNGNGTWTAIDPEDTYLTMLDDTTFQIENADAEFLDPVTYKISSTNL